jgi:hypothetical protein
MNWAYIAGFFDGEGCLSLHTTRMNISIYQSGAIGEQVLREIGAWLSTKGIESIMYHRNRTDKLSKKELWEVRLNKRASQLKFLSGVLPFIRVKKVLAQDCVRYYTMFPPNNWWMYGTGRIGEENRVVWRND